MSEHFWKNSAINFAALTIPAFFLFIGLEYAFAVKQKRAYVFKFESSIANISIGLAERLLNLFLWFGNIYYLEIITLGIDTYLYRSSIVCIREFFKVFKPSR